MIRIDRLNEIRLEIGLRPRLRPDRLVAVIRVANSNLLRRYQKLDGVDYS